MLSRSSVSAGLAAVVMAATGVAPIASSGPAPDRPERRFEIRFMKQTIQHHMMAVAMAEMCVDKATAPPPATDATLGETCTKIAAAQQAEIDQLKAWLLAWYGIDYDPTMSDDGTMRRLERATGESFDIKVSQLFVEHHLQQIRQSTKCLVRAHPELRDFCQKTIVDQSAEIVTFMEILEDHGERFDD